MKFLGLSIMNAHASAMKLMTRTYTLKRRAEQQAETRQRIVEAAVDLHGSVGPARTTFSMVAERAGVQRHTLYAHFPDERSLLMACSGLALERDPLPDPAPWRSIEDRHERLRVGLTAIYGWYERNAELAACVLRDAETSSAGERNCRVADGTDHRGLSRDARREAQCQATGDAAAGPELLYVADPGPRRRAHAGALRSQRCCKPSKAQIKPEPVGQPLSPTMLLGVQNRGCA